MRVGVLVFVMFALSIWFGAPHAFHAYHLHQGQALFYEDTIAAERHLDEAASTGVRNPWAHIYLARIMMTRDELEDAEAQIELAFQKLSSQSDFDRMVLLNEAGKLGLRRAEYQDALTSFTQAMELVESLRAEPNSYPDLAEDAAISSLNISRALRQLGRLDEALEMAERSLQEREMLAPPLFSSPQAFSCFSSPQALSCQGDLIRMRAVAQSDIGDILVDLERPEEALVRYDEAARLYLISSNAGAPINQARRDQAGVQWDVARVHLGLGDVDASLEAFLTTLDLMESVAERDPAYPNILWHHSQVIFETVELFKDHPDLSGFEQFQLEHLLGRINRTADDHYAIWAHLFAGDRFAARNEPEAALQAFERALEKAESRASQRPEEPVIRREIWIAHLRAAHLALPQSTNHARSALSLLEALQADGHLVAEDEQYIQATRELLQQ